MQTTIFGLITGIVTIGSLWLRYKLTQAKQDRTRADEAEKTAQDMEKGLKAFYDQSIEREKRLVAISGGLSDSDASSLLSRDIEPPKLPDPSRAEDAKGGS